MNARPHHLANNTDTIQQHNTKIYLERLLLLDGLGALALLALVLLENDGALAIAVAALRLHLLNHARACIDTQE